MLWVASVALIVLTLPFIVTGRVDSVRDVAALEAALGLALVVVLLQPWRASGVAAVAAPAGAALVTLELYAMSAGVGSVVDLTRHVLVLVGGLAAWRMSRRLPPLQGGYGAPGPSIRGLWSRRRSPSRVVHGNGTATARAQRREHAA